MYTVLRAVSVDSIVIYWLMELHSPGKGVYQFVGLQYIECPTQPSFLRAKFPYSLYSGCV